MAKILTPEHEAADALLAELAEGKRRLAFLDKEALEKLEALKAVYQKNTQPLRDKLARLEKVLLALEKRHRAVFFEGDSCKVDLPHGALIYNLSRYVKRARAVTPERLEELGFPEGVKVVKSVDWDILSGWPDTRLLLVGTARVAKEEFGYEVKE